MRNKKLLSIALATAYILTMVSCGERKIEASSSNEAQQIDSSKSTIVDISGSLFSIPSPIQTTVQIQNSNAEYRPDMMSEFGGYKEFQSNVAKATNLGIFGTDMAYSSIFEDSQSSLNYFKAVNYLANDLGISSSISPELLNRLAANADNTDSLLTLTGKLYEEGDAYLKENKRYDIATCILLGGWIESSLLTANSALEGNEAAKTRLAEQKKSASTILKAWESTKNADFKSNSITQILDSLSNEFSKVQSSYTYQAPVTNPASKTTTLKSSTSYSINDSALTSIYGLLVSARAKISER